MSINYPLPGLGREVGPVSLPAPGSDGLRPAQRIVVLVVITAVIIVTWLAGRSPSEAIGLMLAGTAVADQLCRWLGGRTITAGA